MNRYIIPKILCAIGILTIFAGIFFSELNITLGDILTSSLIAAGINIFLLSCVILAYYMKKTNNMRKLHIFKTVEFLSIFLFFMGGISSLLIFNHCITVWQQEGKIKDSLNIHQLNNLLPDYENYADTRTKNYEIQLDTAIRNSRNKNNQSDLINLGFEMNSLEALESQKTRKINKLKQIVYPHDSLKIAITDSITKLVNSVDKFSPITLPKNITKIDEWVKSWKNQLVVFSDYMMKGENAEKFKFECSIGNVKNILTDYGDYSSPKRYPGYAIGGVALICMLFPYLKVKISNKRRGNGDENYSEGVLFINGIIAFVYILFLVLVL